MMLFSQKTLYSSCSCYYISYILSIDFSIRLFDFQFAKLKGMMVGHTAEIIKLAFLDPYPILVSADCVGKIMIWSTKFPFRALFQIDNIHPIEDGEYMASTTSSGSTEGGVEDAG